MHKLHHLEHDGRQWDCMSQAIQQEETVKKAQKQKTVYFSISFQRGVQKKMKQIDRNVKVYNIQTVEDAEKVCQELK